MDSAPCPPECGIDTMSPKDWLGVPEHLRDDPHALGCPNRKANFRAPSALTGAALSQAGMDEMQQRMAGEELAQAARYWVKSDDWFTVLTCVRRWNLDDWSSVMKHRIPKDELLAAARSALYIIEANTVPTAVIRQEAQCSVPAPHDREECNGY